MNRYEEDCWGKVPEDCWECSAYNSCWKIERHKASRGLNPALVAAGCFSLAAAIFLGAVAWSWIRVLLTP